MEDSDLVGLSPKFKFAVFVLSIFGSWSLSLLEVNLHGLLCCSGEMVL